MTEGLRERERERERENGRWTERGIEIYYGRLKEGLTQTERGK